MPACTVCPFCTTSGIQQARETVQVSANVRKFQNDVFTVWRCAGCGSIHSKENADLERYYRNYPFSRMTDTLVMRLLSSQRLRGLIAAGVRKHDSILDFGCGAGLFVTYLKQQGFTAVTGYDKYSDTFNHPAVLKETYDVVLAQDVIEHADNPAQMMRQLVKVLKPGGLLCIGTPCADNIRLTSYEPYGMCLHQPYHRHIFSKKALLLLAYDQRLHDVRLVTRASGESIIPGMNMLFLHEVIRHSGGMLDAVVERIRPSIFLRHPQLIMYMFFGYFFSRKSDMTAYFRK